MERRRKERERRETLEKDARAMTIALNQGVDKLFHPRRGEENGSRRALPGIPKSSEILRQDISSSNATVWDTRKGAF